MADEARYRPWWWPGRRVESVAIALIIVGLTAVSLVAASIVYQTGLIYLSRPGEPRAWLARPAEAGLVLVLALASCGWLIGAWLGERHRHGWPALGLGTFLLALPVLLLLDDLLGATQVGSLFVPPAMSAEALWLLAPAVLLLGLVLGGALGAWWAGLGGGPDSQA
jgi:hypothetical protein